MNFNTLVRYVQAFAENGTRTVIPDTGDTGRASRESGFPPETEGFGAQPPLRTDMNGALHDTDAGIVAYFFGKIFKFSATLSTAGGGYALNSIVASDDNKALWLSQKDDNTTDPATVDQVDWIKIGGGGLIKTTVYGVGTHNFVKNPQTNFAIVEIVAGGGSSDGVPQTGTQSGISSAAGAGAYAKVLLTSDLNQTVTVGAGGVAGTAGAQTGANGAASGFGSLITCPGGNAGTSSIIIADTEYPKSTTLTLDTALPVITAGQILGISAGVGGESAIVIGAEMATSIRGGKSSFSGNAGDGGDGIYSYWGSPDKDGAAGFDGACIIYEFS